MNLHFRPQVPFPPTKAIFVGVDILLAVYIFFYFFHYIFIIPESIRQQAVSAQAMMRSLTFSNVLQISSNVYKFILKSH